MTQPRLATETLRPGALAGLTVCASLPLSADPKGAQRAEHLAFSPDGSHLAVVRQKRGTTGRTAIGAVVLLRLEGGAAVAERMGETAVFVSARTLVTSRYRTYGYLVSIASGKEERSVGLGPPIAHAPRGELFAAATYTGALGLYDLKKSDRPLRVFNGTGEDPPLVDLVFDPSERCVVAVLASGEVRCFSVPGGEPEPPLGGPDARASRAAFSPDGATLALGLLGGGARVLRASDGGALFSVDAPAGERASVAFSPDGSLLAVGGDAQIVLLDAGTGERLAGLDVAGEALAFSPDGRLLAAGGPDAVHLLGCPEGGQGERAAAGPQGPTLLAPLVARRAQEPGGSLGPVQSVAFRHDGELVAAAVGATVTIRRAGDLSLLHALDLEANERVVHRTRRMGPHEVLDLRCDLRVVVGFLHDGTPVAAEWSAHDAPTLGRTATDVVLRLASDGSQIARLSGHRGRVRALLFDPTSPRALTVADQVRIWDLRGGGVEAGQARGEAAAFFPDGRVALADRGVVMLWGPGGGSKIANHGGPISDIAFDASGTLVATHGEGLVRVIRVDTGKRARPLEVTSQGGVSVSFRADGQVVAVADGALRLWSTSGELLGMASQQNAARVRVAAFSPSGGALAWGVEQTSDLCLASC